MIKRTLVRTWTSVIAGLWAFILLVGTAQASTIDTYQPVSGGAQISGSGLVILSSNGIILNGGAGLATGGSILAPTQLVPISLSLSATGSQLTGGSFLAMPAPPSLPLPYLTGAFTDASAKAGVLSFLFAINGGSAAANFGSQVLFNVTSPLFNISTIASLPGLTPPITLNAPATFTISQATVVAPPSAVPLPAGGLLLLTGLAAIAGLRSRRRKRPALVMA